MFLEIKNFGKYRVITYFCLVFLTSCVIGSYFNNSMILYMGFLLIFLSIFFEFKNNDLPVNRIILPNHPDDSSLKFIIDNKESDFWVVKKHIVINGWIYLSAIQQGSNKKIKIWLHKSNFKNKNDIRDLARYVLFSSSY